MALPDGRKLNFRCMGSGSPTILFEGGFAATSTAWVKVQPALSTSYQTCSYDRAGYGFSDPGPEPRDGSAVAADLDAALKAARIRGPFVLVGHSAGGLYIRLLADRRPSEIWGLVFVDPSVPFQDKRMAARFGSGAGSLQPLIDRAKRCLTASEAGALPSADHDLAACVPKPGSSPALDAARLAQARRPSSWRTQISELQTLFTSTSEEVARSNAAYGQTPLVVLTADLVSSTSATPAVRELVNGYWSALHQEIAAMSAQGREERVQGAGHLLMLERPDVVIAAVRSVAEAPHRRSEQQTR